MDAADVESQLNYRRPTAEFPEITGVAPEKLSALLQFYYQSEFLGFPGEMPGGKNSSKKRKTAVASTVSRIDPKEQLQAEMRSLGYVEGLFIYTIIHANQLPSQACSSISEFFCFAGFMEIFSPATWRPALSTICGWGGKGPQRTQYIDYCTWAYALHAGLCRFGKSFFAILHRKLSSSFS